jgi:4-hydroxybutyrate CoA-transferase
VSRDCAVYKDKLVTAAEAVKCVRSGDGVYLHSNAGVPRTLVDALTERSSELRDVRIYQLITLGPAPYAEPQHAGSFYVHAMFIGHNTRKAVNEGRSDYTPVFFSELPRLFYERRLPVDVVMVQVAPPDADGNMSFGLALDCTPAALKNARIVIAEVNKQTPRTSGSHSLNVADADMIVEADYALPELPPEELSEAELTLGRNVASLVEDGATIQMGIGAIPDAVLRALRHKKDLGVHSEMVSDGIVELVNSGVVNNSKKTVIPGKIAVSFMFGSKRLYDFMHNNELVEFHTTEFINDPFVIAQNYKMTAINSALQIDLTGQVCADSLGNAMYSGCGGQVDFVRGAKRSAGGKAIMALRSTAKGDTISRICSTLKPGSGVVTSRADVQYVVTEYGIADLFGKNMKDRVTALIAIAHPKFQAQLEEEAYALFKWLGGARTNEVAQPSQL